MVKHPQPAKWLRLRCPRHEYFTAVLHRDTPVPQRCPACRCVIHLVAPIARGETTLDLPAYFLKDGKRWTWNGKTRKKQPGSPKGAVSLSPEEEVNNTFSTEIVASGMYP